MTPLISIIIPNRNGEATIGLCLEAVYRSTYEPFEVIVVDDDSGDRSVAEVERFPCRLVRLDRHGGASAARNAGAAASRGEILFFTDSDCLLEADTLAIAAAAFAQHGPEVIVGGTYTPSRMMPISSAGSSPCSSITRRPNIRTLPTTRPDTRW